MRDRGEDEGRLLGSRRDASHMTTVLRRNCDGCRPIAAVILLVLSSLALLRCTCAQDANDVRGSIVTTPSTLPNTTNGFSDEGITSAVNTDILSSTATSTDTTTTTTTTSTTTSTATVSTASAVNATESIKRLWGVADTVAVVGRLFQYHIPSDAFSGAVHRYEVTAAGSTDLPTWLLFNSSTAMLEGVPSELSVGQQYISVKAVGTSENSFAKDVFSIDIMPDNHERSHVPLKSFGQDLQRCVAGEHITKMTITVDADVNKMDAPERIQLIQKIADYLMLNKGWIQLLSRKKENYLDLSAIFAGPGNVHQVETAGAVLQWQVGCNGNIDAQQQEQLNQLEVASRNGTLAEVLGYPVIGWHISTYVNSINRRIRRQLALSYPTPVPGVQPTGIFYPESEWDDRGDRYGLDIEVQPESRIVPTMSSPVYREPHHSDYRKTHHPEYTHHRRTKTRGRHNHHHGQVTPSPVYRRPATRSGIDLQGTIVPTPEIFPVHPTTSLEELSPTFSEETFIFPFPDRSESIHSSLVMSPSYPVMTESSSPSYPEFSHSPTRDPVPTLYTPIPSEPNMRPMLKHRIQKLAITYGKVFEFVIPAETFHDREDGNTRNLKLSLTSAEANTSSLSWIRLNPSKQMIYGLPLKQDIGVWKFMLNATDRNGATAGENVEISVTQHQMDRKFNHEFNLTVEYDPERLTHLVDRNILFIRKLRELYKERDSLEFSNITLKEATAHYFVWSNDSFAQIQGCNKKNKTILQSPMVQEKKLTQEFIRILEPQFRNPSLRWNWIGYCQPPTTTTAFVNNTPPETRNRIKKIHAVTGRLLNFSIPDDTFYDDQQTPLQLELKDHSYGKIKKKSWIRYDSTLNALVGLPLEGDRGEHKFHLIAIDNHNKSATDTFVVNVTSSSEFGIPSVQFSIILKFDFVKFNDDLSHKLKVLDKLAHLYGDPDGRYVTIMKIEHGSVDLTWTNNTLSMQTCQKTAIDNLISFLFDQNKTITKRLVHAFQPEYEISRANVFPGAACEMVLTSTSVTVLPQPTEETGEATGEDDIFISTIIPAVVIAAMLLLAAIVACILYRKKRKGKMTMEDNSTFVNKGIPVIFADELEEKQDPTKAPMIMKEEKPPLPPPEYPRTSGGSSPSTPPLERKDLSSHHHPRSSPHHQHSRHPQHHGSSTFSPSSTLEHTENSPLYQPPPPFTTYRDSRMNRPKNTPTYRMPPPYVPP